MVSPHTLSVCLSHTLSPAAREERASRAPFILSHASFDPSPSAFAWPPAALAQSCPWPSPPHSGRTRSSAASASAPSTAAPTRRPTRPHCSSCSASPLVATIRARLGRAPPPCREGGQVVEVEHLLFHARDARGCRVLPSLLECGSTKEIVAQDCGRWLAHPPVAAGGAGGSRRVDHGAGNPDYARSSFSVQPTSMSAAAYEGVVTATSDLQVSSLR